MIVALRTKRNRTMALLGTAFLAACTQLSFTAVNLPTSFDSVDVIHDIGYGPRPDQKLDIYQPPDGGGKKLPVVVFLYGGRWETGSKDDYAFVGSALAKRNYIVVIPDYRKYPEVRFPSFVEDAAAAFAWTHANIERYGGANDDLFLMGHSAGAHIASLLATDPRYLKAQGLSRRNIKAFAGLAGPYDFVPDEDDLKDMFGPPADYPKMRATTFVDGRQPPMLLLWGETDTFVGRQNLDRLASRIHRKGGCVKVAIYPGLDHIWILGTVSWLGKKSSPVLSDIVQFFDKPECP